MSVPSTQRQGFRKGDIVTLTGGTGGYNLVRGLRHHIGPVTSIYTSFDNGASSGRLRTEFGILPPGDARRLILAQSKLEEDDTLPSLWKHRLDSKKKSNGSSLHGHNIGNIGMLAATELWGVIEGIRRIARLFRCEGEILPISLDDSHLVACLDDQVAVYGETDIDLRKITDDRLITDLMLHPSARICMEAARALLRAKYIIVGPGDFYTSLLPIFLVEGVAEVLAASSAKIIFVTNLMTKYSETRGFSPTDFLAFMVDARKYGIGRDKFDAVIVNTGEIPGSVLEHYQTKEKAEPILYFEERHRLGMEKCADRIILGDFVSKTALVGDEPLIHHDGEALAQSVLEYIRQDQASPSKKRREQGFITPSAKEHETLWILDLDDTLVETTRRLNGDEGKVGKLTLAPGTFSFIKQLIRKRCQFVLVSKGKLKLQRQKLEVVGLAAIFGRRHVVHSDQGKRRLIKKLVKEAGLPCYRIIVVGDRRDSELAVGRELGCKTICVTLPHGKYTPQGFVSLLPFAPRDPKMEELLGLGRAPIPELDVTVETLKLIEVDQYRP